MHIKDVQMSLLLVFFGVAETIGKAKANASQAISELINIVSDLSEKTIPVADNVVGILQLLDT